MRFLIAGASGFLGTLLREELGRQGHPVSALVRRTPSAGHEIQWDPYEQPLAPSVIDEHDVVVNLAGSATAGNPHSKKWARELEESRVTTTRVLAEAIAASTSRPRFLAGNAIALFGQHGPDKITEESATVGGGLLTKVSVAWKAAAAPAEEAGAHVTYLCTAPIYDRRSQPLSAVRLLFKAGLGGPMGDGLQHVGMISARDWVDAVIHLATAEVSGPVILATEEAPTNAEFTRELASQVGRPAFFKVPAFVLGPAAGELSVELLGSYRLVPAALLASGFTFSDPDVRTVLREGLMPSR